MKKILKLLLLLSLPVQASGYYNMAAFWRGFKEITTWTDVTGLNKFGVNFAPPKDAGYIRGVEFNGKFYLAWSEAGGSSGTDHQVRVFVFNGNPVSPGWTRVDTNLGGVSNATNEGINVSNTDFGTRPFLAVSDGELYCAWREGNVISDTSTAAVIRVARYNGNDGSPDWTILDPDATKGWSFSSTAKSSFPTMAHFDNKLFVTWQELGTYSAVKVRYLDHSDDSYNWADPGTADGINFNVGGNRAANGPRLVVLPLYTPKLYNAWTETDGTAIRLRVKAYGGGTTWNQADNDGGVTGLAYADAVDPGDLGVTADRNKIYVSWTEDLTTIRLKSYDGSNDASPTWNQIDGGGLNFDLPNAATEPAYLSGLAYANNKVYASWIEYNLTADQVRAKVLNGSTWESVDGGGVNGLNKNTAKSTVWGFIFPGLGKLFSVFLEDASYTVTFTGSSDLCTLTAHGFVNDNRLQFRTVTTTTPNITTNYWVINATANTFQLSTTQGGSTININANGSGTIGSLNNVMVKIGQ